MSMNLGTITYGDLSVYPGFDSASSGFGNLTVAGTSLLAGASTNIMGSLGVVGNSSLSSSLTVGGVSTFNAPSTFNDVANFLSTVTFSNVTDSTNANSGSLQVKGGLGVSLSTNLGGTLNVTGATTLRSTLAVTGTSAFSSAVSILDTTESNSYTQGALIVSGGLGVAGNIQSGVGSVFLAGNLILNSVRTTGYTYLNSPANDLFINNAGVHNVYVNSASSANFKVANAINVNNSGLQVLTTTDSTSLTNGSFLVAGGAAIGKTLFVGGNFVGQASQTLTIGSVLLTATTQSSSSTTGAFNTAGGMGIAKSVFIGGILDVASTASTYSSIGNFRFLSSSNGSNWIQSGDVSRTNNNWTPLKFSPLGSSTSIFTVNSGGVTVDTNATSTSATSGALIVTGGSGISGDLFVGETLNVAGVSVYSNDIWMTGNNLYLGTYNDQANGLVYSSSASTGGPLLFGLNGGALGTTVGSLKVALTWDSSQNVQVKGAADTTSVGTGALVVAGGIGIGKSAFIGTSLFVQGGSWTSTGTDVYLNSGGSNINIRNTAGSNSGEFESNLTNFNFRTANVTSPNTIAPFRCLVIDKVTGYVSARQTDDTTGNQTGSLQVYGGQSISKALWVGGNTTILGNLSVVGTITSANIYSDTSNSTSTTSGSVVISGGLGVGMNTFIGGRLVVTDTTESTTALTGSVVVGGGLGVNSNINVGGNGNIGGTLTVSGNITGAGNSVTFTNTTTSSSITTGAVIINGGLGLGGNVYVGGIGNFTNTAATSSVITGSIVTAGGVGIAGGIYLGGVLNITNATGSLSATTGSIVTAGGAGIGQNLNVAGNTTVNGSLTVAGNIDSTGGTVTFTNTLDSTSPTSGAVVFMGGVGIAQSLFVGSTIASTSPTSGGLVLSGGLGVSGAVFFNGNQTLAGTNPLFTFNNSGLSAPTFTSRSIGTKMLLYAAGGANAVDYAIGMENNAMWQSVPTNTSTQSFRWYGGNTLTMQLDGLGNIGFYGTVDSSSPSTGALQISGGVGISKSVYIGAALNVAGTTYINGSLATNTNATIGGLLAVTNVTDSTGAGNGSINTTGGLGVTLSANIGQNLGVVGNTTVTGNLATSGTYTSNNVTESTGIGNGSAVFLGGVGIAKNVNIGGTLVAGSTTINGNLYVNGSRTEILTQIVDIKDNVLVLNSGPGGSATSGVAMKRYQFANDSAFGDVVTNDTPEVSGMVQTGSTTSTIIFGSEASSVDGWYNGGWVILTTGTGVGQVRRINTYIGSTRTATIYTSADQSSLAQIPIEGLDWTTVPDTTSGYAIFTTQYVVTVYDEINGEYGIGSTAVNPVSSPQVPIRNRIKVHAGTLRLDNNLYVDNISQYNTGAGTTVESVLIKSGAMSGIVSQNGNSMPVTGTVTLIDNDPTATAVIPGTHTYGSYIVLVSDVNNSGSAATFLITGSVARGGSVFRATATNGSNNEHLTIVWTQGDYPRLKFMAQPNNSSGAYYSYKVKMISQ